MMRNGLLLLLAAAALLETEVMAQPTGGDDDCPCIASRTDANGILIAPETETLRSNIGADINLETYGLGCAPHDLNATICSDTSSCTSIVPLPPDCDRSYCKRSWCLVDPQNCTHLLSTPSPLFPGLHYSYATCGEMDSFTFTERLLSLRGKTLNVGYNSNTGGWKGAYNPQGSFAVNNLWQGPIVDFMRMAAMEGGFTINITTPPDWIRPKSQSYFGNSSFDYCVYAASLGYLDLCVGAYTITEKRASVTTFFETTSDPLYLIVFSEEESSTSWETFRNAALTVFQPFTFGAWLMIFCFCLPLLGLLMLLHEYNSPGSAYQNTEPVLVTSGTTTKSSSQQENGSEQQQQQEWKVVTKRIPIIKHVLTTWYMSALSFFQGSYDQSVVTVGGKINLMAISSFIMLVLAVYTANLAAILTQDIQSTSVDSLDMAIQAGYNFCASRKMAEIIMNLHRVDPNRFVVDPVELGGDGMPGFNCPSCNVRERVFDYMKMSNNGNDDRSLYCNAAIASLEDLQVLHKYGKHCDKMRIGESLGYRTIGIPINSGISDELVSLFHRMKTDGIMDQALGMAEPASQCPETEGEGTALSIQQLTGIWVVTFGIAFCGLVAKLIHVCARRRSQRQQSRRLSSSSYTNLPQQERKLQRYDQWGNPTSHDIIVDGYRFNAENHELEPIIQTDINDESDETGYTSKNEPRRRSDGEISSTDESFTATGAYNNKNEYHVVESSSRDDSFHSATDLALTEAVDGQPSDQKTGWTKGRYFGGWL